MITKTEFTALIQQHQGILYKVSSIYAKDQEDQKDLYQEIVYQLWKSIDSFKAKSKLSTWIYRLALNTSIAHLNKEKKRVDKNRLQLDFKIPVESYDPTYEDRLKQLYALIQSLNMIEKGIIVLYLEGKSYEEIAQITGFTPSNIGTRLSRIKQKLKEQVQKERHYGI